MFLFALSCTFPRGPDGKASLPLQFARRTAASRWENKTGSLFHLRAAFNISIDVKPSSPIAELCILQRRNSRGARSNSYERITSCNLTRCIPPSPPVRLLRLMYVTSGSSLYTREIIRARRKGEAREFVT